MNMNIEPAKRIFRIAILVVVIIQGSYESLALAPRYDACQYAAAQARLCCYDTEVFDRDCELYGVLPVLEWCKKSGHSDAAIRSVLAGAPRENNPYIMGARYLVEGPVDIGRNTFERLVNVFPDDALVKLMLLDHYSHYIGGLVETALLRDTPFLNRALENAGDSGYLQARALGGAAQAELPLFARQQMWKRFKPDIIALRGAFEKIMNGLETASIEKINRDYRTMCGRHDDIVSRLAKRLAAQADGIEEFCFLKEPLYMMGAHPLNPFLRPCAEIMLEPRLAQSGILSAFDAVPIAGVPGIYKLSGIPHKAGMDSVQNVIDALWIEARRSLFNTASSNPLAGISGAISIRFSAEDDNVRFGCLDGNFFAVVPSSWLNAPFYELKARFKHFFSDPSRIESGEITQDAKSLWNPSMENDEAGFSEIYRSPSVAVISFQYPNLGAASVANDLIKKDDFEVMVFDLCLGRYAKADLDNRMKAISKTLNELRSNGLPSVIALSLFDVDLENAAELVKAIDSFYKKEGRRPPVYVAGGPAGRNVRLLYRFIPNLSLVMYGEAHNGILNGALRQLLYKTELSALPAPGEKDKTVTGLCLRRGGEALICDYPERSRTAFSTVTMSRDNTVFEEGSVRVVSPDSYSRISDKVYSGEAHLGMPWSAGCTNPGCSFCGINGRNRHALTTAAAVIKRLISGMKFGKPDVTATVELEDESTLAVSRPDLLAAAEDMASALNAFRADGTERAVAVPVAILSQSTAINTVVRAKESLGLPWFKTDGLKVGERRYVDAPLFDALQRAGIRNHLFGLDAMSTELLWRHRKANSLEASLMLAAVLNPRGIVTRFSRIHSDPLCDAQSVLEAIFTDLLHPNDDTWGASYNPTIFFRAGSDLSNAEAVNLGYYPKADAYTQMGVLPFNDPGLDRWAALVDEYNVFPQLVSQGNPMTLYALLVIAEPRLAILMEDTCRAALARWKQAPAGTETRAMANVIEHFWINGLSLPDAVMIMRRMMQDWQITSYVDFEVLLPRSGTSPFWSYPTPLLAAFDRMWAKTTGDVNESLKEEDIRVDRYIKLLIERFSSSLETEQVLRDGWHTRGIREQCDALFGVANYYLEEALLDTQGIALKRGIISMYVKRLLKAALCGMMGSDTYSLEDALKKDEAVNAAVKARFHDLMEDGQYDRAALLGSRYAKILVPLKDSASEWRQAGCAWALSQARLATQTAQTATLREACWQAVARILMHPRFMLDFNSRAWILQRLKDYFNEEYVLDKDRSWSNDRYSVLLEKINTIISYRTCPDYLRKSLLNALAAVISPLYMSGWEYNRYYLEAVCERAGRLVEEAWALPLNETAAILWNDMRLFACPGITMDDVIQALKNLYRQRHAQAVSVSA